MPEKFYPLVSVIIPTYNRYALLQEAVASVLDQSYPNIEIIVVDDGSTDDTPQIKHKLGSAIKYIAQANAGLNAARNTGYRQSKGEYIALLDDDDLWVPDKTFIQVEYLRRMPEIAFAFSDFTIFNKKGIIASRGLATWMSTPLDWRKVLGPTFASHHSDARAAYSQKDFPFYTGSLYRALLKDPYVLPATSMIRKNMIDGAHPFPIDNTHCGDWAFFARLSLHHSCIFIDAALAFNRSHQDAVRLTRQPLSERLNDRLDLVNDIWGSDKDFSKRHAHELRREKETLLEALIRALITEGKRAVARRIIHQYANRNPKVSLRLWFYRLLALIPGLHLIIRFAHRILHKLEPVRIKTY